MDAYNRLSKFVDMLDRHADERECIKKPKAETAPEVVAPVASKADKVIESEHLVDTSGFAKIQID